jgi:hypothetical protein
MASKLTYRVQEVESDSDGQYYRLIADYTGRFSEEKAPRHIERLSEEQAYALLSSLTDSLGETGPRKWGHGDDNPVQCPGCGATWAANSLYKTGDVLRCPGCDGVMRP